MTLFKRYENMTSGALLARLMTAYVSLGFASSILLQPDVIVPARSFLQGAPFPFWWFGVVYLLSGLLTTWATWFNKTRVLRRTLSAMAFVWFLWGCAYLKPVFDDWHHVPWSGFVLFTFVAGTHQVMALIEAHRYAGVGMFRHEGIADD